MQNLEIEIHQETEVYRGYRSNRVRSLFNVDDDRGARFDLTVGLDLAEAGEDWQIGLVVGPSGSGKTSIGRELVRSGGWRLWAPRWPKDKPIIEAIGVGADMDTATGALAAVGLGDVPAWLRPYHVLSMGEQFRANLGRLVAEATPAGQYIVDEFSSVVDRQIAQIGSGAFAKSLRRTGGRAVLLSCHNDIVPWVIPDWCYDTGTGELTFPKEQGSIGPASNSRSGKSDGRIGTCSGGTTTIKQTPCRSGPPTSGLSKGSKPEYTIGRLST